MTITQHRWSIAAAWQNAAAQQQRVKNDVVPFTPWRIAAAAFITPYYALSPANTTHRHSAGATARVVHVAGTQATATLSFIAVVASLLAILEAPNVIRALTIVVISAPLFIVCVGSISDWRAARETPNGTHLLIDLIRDPNSTPGHSSELVHSMKRHPPDVVTGICPNDHVWAAAYNGNAEATGPTLGSKIRFVLDPKT